MEIFHKSHKWKMSNMNILEIFWGELEFSRLFDNEIENYCYDCFKAELLLICLFILNQAVVG
jgi:hypothetical protein